MIGLKRRVFLVLTVLLTITAGIMSAAYADSIAETVQAFSGVKIIYNGKVLTGDKQPYIIDSTTYVPLRLLMNNFDKEINYDSSFNQVIIKDKASTTVESLNKKITELNTKITTLQNENKKLQSENTTLKSTNAALTSKNTTLTNRIAALEDDDDELSVIEDDLNDDYENAGDDYFSDDEITTSISLDGDEDDLEFDIYLDFSDSDDNDDMTDLSSTKVKSLLKALYEDIEDAIEDTDYEDADIIGTIEDDNDNFLEYDGSTYGYLSDLSDIEDNLNNDYEDAGEDFFSDDEITTSISLDGDEDDLELYVYLDFDYSDDNDDMTDLTKSNIQRLIKAIYVDIEDAIEDTDYEGADITSSIEDDNDNTLDYDGNTYDYSW